MNPNRLFVTLMICLLQACAGAPVQNQYYLLRPTEPLQTRALAPSTEFAMGEVDVAPYIDQPGIVLETAEGQVRPARNHRWAEPLPRALGILLAVEVSRRLDQDILPRRFSAATTVFNVQIEELHGTPDGKALLVAYWWLERGGEILASYQFTEREALAADGYAELVRAERALLLELAGRIAASLEAARESQD